MAVHTEKAEKETLGFQAEVTQLLDLMIHSLYSNNEANTQTFADLAHILFDQSLLSCGDQIENPIRFVNRLDTLLAQF